MPPNIASKPTTLNHQSHGKLRYTKGFLVPLCWARAVELCYSSSGALTEPGPKWDKYKVTPWASQPQNWGRGCPFAFPSNQPQKEGSLKTQTRTRTHIDRHTCTFSNSKSFVPLGQRWVWVKKRSPTWNPGRWNQRLKPAVPRFDVDTQIFAAPSVPRNSRSSTAKSAGGSANFWRIAVDSSEPTGRVSEEPGLSRLEARGGGWDIGKASKLRAQRTWASIAHPS